MILGFNFNKTHIMLNKYFIFSMSGTYKLIKLKLNTFYRLTKLLVMMN